MGYFSFAVLDYFCPDENRKTNRLFDFKQSTTQHTIDATVAFNGTKNLPLQIMASTLIYGDDLRPNTNKNYYSTYIEANYTWKRTPSQHFDFFIGITPFEGYYANSFNLVNSGLSVKQNITVTETFQIPLFGKLYLNPHTENIYLVFGLTLSV